MPYNLKEISLLLHVYYIQTCLHLVSHSWIFFFFVDWEVNAFRRAREASIVLEMEAVL